MKPNHIYTCIKAWGFGFGLMTESVPQMKKDSWEAKHYMVKKENYGNCSSF